MSLGTATCYASRVNLQPRINVKAMDELKQAEIERVKIARQQAGIKEPKPPPVFAEQQWRKP